MAGNCHPHTVKNPFRPAIHGYIPLNSHDISVELINTNILRLPRCDDPNLRHFGEHMYRMIPASCGSTPAKANLQSLLLEKPSLENLDSLSSFWSFYQRPVASTDCLTACCAGLAKSKAPEEAANDALYGVRPRTSNKDTARHIAILPSYSVQPSTLNMSSAMNV